jgi:hypothetical protein
MNPVIKSYSPNISNGVQVVEITFMAWGYKAAFTQRVGGNCRGWDVIGSAVGAIYDNLPTFTADIASIELTNAAGEKLLVEDEEEIGEDWLKKMIVSASIIAWEPPTLNEVRAKNGRSPIAGGDVPYNPDC